MISFNDINFQWETEGNQQRLIIVINNATTISEDAKQSIIDVLKAAFNE